MPLQNKRHLGFILLSSISMLLAILVIPIGTFGAQLPMRHYTTDEGLVNNEVITVFQDNRGYLWFGTYAGLSRFDGKRFKNYDAKKLKPGSAVIRAIAEDHQHTVWIGYSGGVARLTPDPTGDQFAYYTNEDGLLGKDIVGIQPDSRGGVWILTEQGINYFNGEGFVSKPIDGINTNLSGTHLQCTTNGEVFLVAQERLYKLLAGSSDLALKPCSQVTFKVKSIKYASNEDALYLISSDKLYRLKDDRCILVASSPLKDSLLNLTVANDNTVWVISETMLWHRMPDGNIVYSNEMLHSKSLSNVTEDREGNLWLTTWSGVSMIVQTKIVNYPDLPVKIVSNILKDPEDHLWVAGDQGIVRISPGNDVLFHKKSSFVEFLFYDRGKIFTSTDSGGLHIYNLQGELLATHKPDVIFTCMLKDSRGKYWLGSYKGLFSMSDTEIVLEMNTRLGLGSNTVWALLDDHAQRLWVGTENGLSCFADGQWHHYDARHGLTHPSIWHLHEHKNWGVLAATSHGISRWHNDRFTSLPVLADMPIDNLATDPDGTLWVGSGQGIFKINAGGNIDLSLNKNKGLPVNSTYFRTAFINSPYLFMGTHKGLTRVELDIEDNTRAKPMLYMDKILVNKRPKSHLNQPLEHFEKHITFFFHAVYMYQPDRVTYSYFLDGMDEQWSEKTDLLQAVYTNLPPGEYTFNVRAFADGKKMSPVQSVSFTIKKAFWQTWYFICFEILSGLLLIILVSHLASERKIRKQEAYARQLECTVAERTRILAEASKAAQAANRAKSAFLAGMTHEIRTPLNGIAGMTDILLDSELSEEQRSYAQTAHKSSQALLTIIDDVLDFSRIEAGAIDLKNEPFDLMSLVEDLGRLLSPQADEKDINLIIRYSPDVPKYFEGDAGRIRQVLLNLAGNAIKFTEQGYVLIDIYRHNITEKEATIHLRIEDSGIGIPTKYLSTIFDRFTQTDAGSSRKYGGTGLGLAISSQLVSLMGSEIKVNSTPGEGSTFHFVLTLPRVKPRTGTLKPAVDLSGMRVLVVADNRIQCQVLNERLEAWGIACNQAESKDEALQKMNLATKKEKPYNVVLVDHHIFKMVGAALGQEIRMQSALNTTKLVLISSINRLPDKKTLAESCVDACLDKPVRSGQLFNFLHKIRSAQTTDDTVSLFEEETVNNYEHPFRFKARILLVEDIPSNRKVALAMLNRYGCDVDIAENGEEAIQRAREQAYDMIFMDCQLPVMDGFEATHLIRKYELHKKKQTGSGEVKHVPIVAMTANVSEEDRQRCLAAGMDFYLTKPISRTKVLELLKERLTPSKDTTGSNVHRVLIALEHSKENHIFEHTLDAIYPDTVIKYPTCGIEICTLMAGFLPELMILDDTLNGIDTIALLEYLKGHERFGSIHTIVITDLDKDAPQIKALSATGCNHILQRPLQIDFLEKTLEEIVSGVRQDPIKAFNHTLTYKEQQDSAPVLNSQRLLQTFQGDNEMVQGYIDIFMKDMPEVMAELETSIETWRMDSVIHQAHKMKNIAAEAGGEHLFSLAASMEKEAMKGNRHLCEQQLPELKVQYRMLVEAIQKQKW